MNAAILIATGMIVVVLGVAALALVLDYRDDRGRDLLAAMEAVKRAERERGHAALAASLEVRESREHDRVTLAPAEKKAFAEITGHMKPGCVCGHSGEAHEHYRAGNDCSLCGCGQYRVAQADQETDREDFR